MIRRATLVQLKDGTPALLFYVPDTHVIRLVGLTYREALDLFGSRVSARDKDNEKWALIVEKHHGSTVVGVIEL